MSSNTEFYVGQCIGFTTTRHWQGRVEKILPRGYLIKYIKAPPNAKHHLGKLDKYILGDTSALRSLSPEELDLTE